MASITVQELTPTEVGANTYQCEHCRHVGNDVQRSTSNIHGRQIVHYFCVDAADCWRRWDQRMGLASYGLEG